MRRSLLAATVMAFAVLLGAPPSDAAVTQVFSRSALPSGTFDWSAFGPTGTGISTPDFRPGGVNTVGVASSSGSMLLRQEGTDFTGNFAPGDNLLTLDDFDRSDNFIVSFTDSALFHVVGIGTQIQPVSGFTGAFTGILDLFSASNVLLGQVTVSGNSTTAEDNSAVFIGAISGSTIDHAIFSVSTGLAGFPIEGDLAINQLNLLIEAVDFIPEPSTVLLFGFGLIGLTALRRPRNRGA